MNSLHFCQLAASLHCLIEAADSYLREQKMKYFSTQTFVTSSVFNEPRSSYHHYLFFRFSLVLSPI
jgi:hypothetical protein